MNWTIYNSWRPCYKLSFIINYSFAPSFQCCGELFPVTKEVPSTIPGNIYCRIKQKIFCHIFINLYLHLIYTMYVKYVVGAINMLYIYIRLKIKPNNVRIRFQCCQNFVLPSTGFELTPLIHCSTIRLALRPAPQTTRPHPLPIYKYIYYTIL